MQKCPFEAIQIINLPKDLAKDTTHRYGPNTFKLHRSVSCFTLQSSVGGQYVLALGMIVICIPDFMFCYADVDVDSHEVMTALIVVLPLIVVVEISLQLHRWFCYADVGRLLSNEKLFRCDSTVLIVLLLL